MAEETKENLRTHDLGAYNFKKWIQAQRLLWIFFVLVGINIFFSLLSNFVQSLRPLLGFVWFIILVIGIPVIIYDEAWRKKSTYDETSSHAIQEAGLRKNLRKILLLIYVIAFAVSLLVFISYGAFSFDSSGLDWARYGVFWSSALLPVSIIIGMVKSKMSMYWFLLPVLPIITFVLFSYALDKYITDSDLEFCREAIRNNDREILDNPTISCYDLVNGK